jgi:diamine N-acetyltransferase
MILQGINIVLRAPEPEDIDVLYLWENDPGIWKISNTQTPYSRYILEQYILNAHEDIYKARQLRLMIDLKDSGKKKISIGAIDLFDFDPANKRAGVGILIDKSARNRGYATEALKLLIDYCFSVLSLHQLYCNISTDNTQSMNLFTKSGFQTIGIKKDWIYFEHKWNDEYVLQLINNNENGK